MKQKTTKQTKKPKLRPNKTIEVNILGQRVRIYRRDRRKGDAVYTQFDVAEYVKDDRTGITKRKFKTFASEKKARAFATDIATKLANRDGAVLNLTSDDKRDYVRADGFVKATGVSLPSAAEQFAEIYKKLGGRVAEAINDFVRRNPGPVSKKTVTEVYDEMIAAKEADGLTAVYLKDLKMRLGKFKKSFQCKIADVTEGQISEWLRKVPGLRNRNNYRLAIRTLFKFATAAGVLHKEHLDFDKVAKAKEVEGQIEIFTPAEMVKLIDAARLNVDNLKPGFNLRYATGPGLLPLLVLGGFAGMRTAEIERQRWEDINLERGFIRVTGAKGNTAQKRLIQPVTENLKQWLAPLRRDSGPVCEIARTPGAIQRLAERAGVKWKHNALRHSYASYRLADVKSAAQVSLEMGNSPKMVFRHYREVVEAKEATEWFSIQPERPANVVSASQDQNPTEKLEKVV